MERFLPEMFPFVAFPDEPARNRLATRSVRPLVITRTISGGSHRLKCSITRMGLASLFSIWLAFTFSLSCSYLPFMSLALRFFRLGFTLS
jgi:hypothetical protein